MRQTKLHGVAIELTHTLYVIGELQTVEIGEIAAVDVMPRMVAIKDALKGKNHVVGIQFTRRRKPGRFLKRHIATQVEAIGCAVIQHLPAFRQFRDQTISIGINIQQPVIELGGQGVDDQPTAHFLRIKGVDLPTHAIDKATVANIFTRGGFRRSSSLTTQKSSHHDQRR